MMAGRITSGRRAGECVDCGKHDARNAPGNCARCAFEWAVDRRFTAVYRDALVSESWHWVTEERLDMLVDVMAAGHIRNGFFYIWVAREDNHLRPLHSGEVTDASYLHEDRRSAEDMARRCAAAFPSGSAWVVTYHGIWKPPARA